MTKMYTLQDYDEIIVSYGATYKLPANVMDTILKLKKDIDETAAINPPTPTGVQQNEYKKGAFNGVRKSKSSHYSRDNLTEDWNAPKSFKATVIEKKEGPEKTMNDIRVCLNKISLKNFDIQTEEIFKHIEILVENDKSCYKNIGGFIFDIASNNKFNSELYATLYKNIIEKHEEFREIIDIQMGNYTNSINQIYYVDPNTDYDKFCEYNKVNDKRKALATFFVNLVKKELIAKSQILTSVSGLINLVLENIEMDNKANEVDEITENVFIFVTALKNECSETAEWNGIKNSIEELSKTKSKDKKSLSSRAIFKYMDIMDTL